MVCSSHGLKTIYFKWTIGKYLEIFYFLCPVTWKFVTTRPLSMDFSFGRPSPAMSFSIWETAGNTALGGEQRSPIRALGLCRLEVWKAGHAPPGFGWEERMEKWKDGAKVFLRQRERVGIFTDSISWRFPLSERRPFSGIQWTKYGDQTIWFCCQLNSCWVPFSLKDITVSGVNKTSVIVMDSVADELSYYNWWTNPIVYLYIPK